MIKAALIDMDGVLYDSMKYHTLAWNRMMTDAGISCTRDEFYLYEGMTGAATIDLLFKRQFGHGVSPEESTRLYQLKTEIFKNMPPVDVMPGAQRMTEILKRHGITCVLVTGSAQNSLITRIDDDYPGVFAPDMRITALDVVNGKPDPEPYLKGLQKAGTRPEETIVIENAPLGVRAGVAAGLRTIAVTTGPVPATEFEAEKPWRIYPSMPQFADDLEKLLNHENL